MKHRGIQGETRALLLYLATRMGIDRKFSVPQGELAQRFEVSVRRIRARVEQAHDAGLLVTVLSGKPGRTAVYQGTFPGPTCAARPAQETTKLVPEGRHKQTRGYVPHVGPPSSKHVEPEPVGFNSAVGVPRSPLRADPATAEESLEESHGSEACFRRETGSGNEVDRETPKGPASAATPGPGGRETPKGNRKDILDSIQQVAADDGLVDELLLGLLNEHADGLGDYAINYWTFPRRVASNRMEAGKQLNMLINTWKLEAA